MIIYNVTLSIHSNIEEEFLTWLKKTHIPEVLETKLFLDGKIYKIIENIETKSHNSFAVQYRLKTWEDFEKYQQHHAKALQQKTRNLFGEQVLAYRTFLESVD
jgi:hypothetical protein